MNWVLRQTEKPPKEALAKWAEQLEISELLAELLWIRDVRDPETIQKFINPSLQFLESLENWPQLLEAGSFLAEALLANKKIAVWGDYDVDGITSTALVLEFLKLHGFSAIPYIPNRIDEGYGLSLEGITTLYEKGIEVLITVDSGICDEHPIALARSLGMSIIITDHHLPGATLPDAHFIINPRVGEHTSCSTLAGVGVAFFLMAATNVALAKAGRERVDVRPLLDLVALGTLADVVDLRGQNRILVKNGLLLIAEGRRVGIAALKSACNLSPTATLGASQIVFSLAPRLNAAGRLGSAHLALDLLLANERPDAARFADELSRLNAERRDEEEKILIQAVEQAKEQKKLGRSGLVVYGPDWHPGIIGIVASRLAELTNYPSVVLCAIDSMTLKGSARSTNDFNIHEAFSACADLLEGFGGHKMAAGLSIRVENLENFRKRFDVLVVAGQDGTSAKSLCRLDKVLPFSIASDFLFLKELEMLQPFGFGNSEPVFCSPLVLVKSMRKRHNFLQLELEDETCGVVLQAKAWRQLALMPLSLKGEHIRIAYTPRIDRYNGAATVELRLKDWKKAYEVIELE